ncbi:sigma-70 family RNA polymerase sigma factor [Stieleria varia]|uniref:ECF RNA polymerase sigma-E factor n=1 Tax=Stieleria varia TaxID=2528005 RepID=A0A5C6AR96_9BACT|nr:sigma-70 family RNA polymerase sigma factor [Stieleria varia]TWU02250.1 ECF RNA polymerase sigma-E factor [Stieleria varia]
MNDEIDPETGLRQSWSIGRLRPWLQMIADRELPDALRGRVEASDIVQQTLLQAWRGEAGFQGTCHAQRLAWLRAILKNTIRDQQRRLVGTKKRGGRELQNAVDCETQEYEPIDILAIAPDPTVSAVLQSAEETLALAAAIESLPEDQRSVVTMRHIDEMSYEEIAAKLGRTNAAVRMLWVRAMKTLGGNV